MMETMVETVTGPVRASALGRTLAHEHMMIGWPGWQSDSLRSGPTRAEALAICLDRVAQMRAHGVRTMIDPCPGDLGRDVELMAEVATRSGLQVVCATGLYKEDQGGAAYWKFRAQFGSTVRAIADLYIHELTRGIGETGIKAGIIKVATGAPRITAYERALLEAAAIASKETGMPVTTHTDEGKLGDEQQRILVELGVPAHRIIIGHSCGSSDFDYHSRILANGSYLGFDRFGIEMLMPDRVRIASLLRLLEAGRGRQVVVSHDSVWCWRGEPIPDPALLQEALAVWQPNHFFERIVPRLRDGGATQEQIDALLIENPRCFFTGETPPGCT
jgi:phosphotriesterase-related protein